MSKLNTGFGDYPIDELLHLGETAANKLPGLAVFATLKPTPAEITAGVTQLQSAIAMEGKGRAQALEAAKANLASLLSDVTKNAPQMTGANATNLAEIGLPLSKTPVRATQPPAAPENFRLAHGSAPGEITGKCNPVHGNIRTYEAPRFRIHAA